VAIECSHPSRPGAQVDGRRLAPHPDRPPARAARPIAPESGLHRGFGRVHPVRCLSPHQGRLMRDGGGSRRPGRSPIAARMRRAGVAKKRRRGRPSQARSAHDAPPDDRASRPGPQNGPLARGLLALLPREVPRERICARFRSRTMPPTVTVPCACARRANQGRAAPAAGRASRLRDGRLAGGALGQRAEGRDGAPQPPQRSACPAHPTGPAGCHTKVQVSSGRQGLDRLLGEQHAL
jgi:hypothetical protein